jgi:hypothetical protein
MRSAGCAALVAMLAAVGCQSSDAPSTHQSQTTPPSARAPPPPPSPTARIAFDMQMATGSRNIYAMALDDTGLVQLTFDAADHHDPTVHDSLVAFGSVRPGGVVIASIAGSADSTPTLFGPGDAPMLSPDGTTLAYLTMSGGLSLVWTAHVDGSEAERFGPAQAGWSGASEAHPVWSPTGDRIAYVSTRAGNAAIYIGAFGGATGSAALLTNSPSGASVEPAWSPDGKQIVFTSNRDGPTDLYIVTVATGAVVRLTTVGNVGQATWLAGGIIVFTQWTAGVAGLVWLDPTNPTVLHPLSTGGDAQHAVAYP